MFPRLFYFFVLAIMVGGCSAWSHDFAALGRRKLDSSFDVVRSVFAVLLRAGVVNFTESRSLSGVSCGWELRPPRVSFDKQALHVERSALDCHKGMD
jgi:hypothetical protein